MQERKTLKTEEPNMCVWESASVRERERQRDTEGGGEGLQKGLKMGGKQEQEALNQEQKNPRTDETETLTLTHRKP